VRIGVNAGQQVSSTRFEQAGSFTDFLEDATFTGAHEIDAGVFYEGNVTARIAGAFTAGLAVSVFSRDDAVDVRAGLPHPFFFNRPRSVSGAPGGLERRETGVHILLGWLLPATDRVEIMITAGPSIFKVEQDFVERVNYTHAYPFDDAQFTGVATERISDNAIGFNAGADVSINLSTNVGVGLLIRYSRGTLDAPSAAGNTVSFDVGGLHAGGGLRLRF
jgi:opacity protein-like surface antigen